MDHVFSSTMPLLAEELTEFEQYLRRFFPDGSLIQNAARDLVTRGGKRLRPALVIAASMTGNYQRDRVLPLAAAIETMHAATLAHDDVIDQAETRRGKPTLHSMDGNHIAIYTGDYMLARSLRILSECDLPTSEIKSLAYAIEQICAGDVSQYTGRGKIPSYRTYLRRIMGKTAMLFAASCAGGAYIGGLEQKQQKQLWHFGMRMGAAFQIRDDLLDIDGNSKAAGKPTGKDLLDGIVTLPVLLATTNQDFREALSGFLTGSRNEIKAGDLIDFARSSGSVERTRKILTNNLEKCRAILSGFPDSTGREYLYGFTDLLQT